MTTQNQRKHAHRRSSSLVEHDAIEQREEKVTLQSSIESWQTMQLIRESQNKSDYQIIVEDLNDRSQKQLQETQKPEYVSTVRNNVSKTMFSEYFQIEEVKELKRQYSAQSNFNLDELTLERMQPEPIKNGRLRYHQNIKEKVFNMSSQRMNFSRAFMSINLDESYSRMESVQA